MKMLKIFNQVLYRKFWNKIIVTVLLLVTPVTETLASEISEAEALKYLGITEEKSYLDYNDPMLAKIFFSDFAKQKEIFRLYEAFINFDRDNKNPKAIEDASKILNELFGGWIHMYNEGINEIFFHALTGEYDQYSCSGENDKDFSSYYLPLWLVIRHPEILEYNVGRFFPEVMRKGGFIDSREFLDVTSILFEMTDGRWVTTSYMQWAGSIIHDINAGYRRNAMLLESYPTKIYGYNRSIEDNLRPLKSWSSENLWNSLIYKKFQIVYPKLESALNKFYNSHSYLKNYDASKVASCIVWYYASHDRSTDAFYILESADEKLHKEAINAAINKNIRITSPEFYDDLTKINADKKIIDYWKNISKILLSSSTNYIDKYKQELELNEGDSKLTQNSSENNFKRRIIAWNEFLSRAILNDFSSETLEVIVKFGADVNLLNFSESPLMNAANKLDVMDMLIKNGAKVNLANPFGKTAIFYAIQYGNYETVKLLIESGAEINKALDSLEQFIILSESTAGSFLLEEVADFTPLVYAMRYGNHDVVELLKKHGAVLGKAPKERIDKWISQK